MHSFVLNIISDFKDLNRILNLLSPDKNLNNDVNYRKFLKSNCKKKLIHLNTKNSKGQKPFELLQIRVKENNPFDANLNDISDPDIIERLVPEHKTAKVKAHDRGINAAKEFSS